MKNAFSLLFYLKAPKGYESGPQPIYIRFTVSGQRAEASTKREIEPARWNSKAGRANGTKEEIKALNAYLDTLQAKIYADHRELMQDNKFITAQTLKNKFTGQGERPRMLIEIFSKHNADAKELIGKGFAEATITRYTTSLSHTVDFLKWKHKVSDIHVKEINHEFVTDYEFYLKSIRGCNHNTTLKYIKNFKKIVRICIGNGWIDRDPFINFHPKYKEVERAFLTEEALQAVISKEFRTERLSLVRDIFVFSCFTGLAYVDVKKLTPEHIVKGIDGEKWIYTHRTKTETRSNIPLLPTALAIIKKYQGHPAAANKGLLLPVLSNQKLNEYLKEIATLCEINKDLTFHIARHTFATTVTLTNGVPIESVSKMLGHKNLRTTQHYAKILDSKVSVDMQILKNKLSIISCSNEQKATG